MNAQSVNRLLKVAEQSVRDAQVSEMSAFRRVHAAMDGMVFYETALQLAMELDDSDDQRGRTRAALISRYGDSVAEDVDVLRRIFRKCPYGCAEIVTGEEADAAVASVVRIQAKVVGWFQDRAASPLAQMGVRRAAGSQQIGRGGFPRWRRETAARRCPR